MGLKGLREGRWEGRDTARRNPGVVPTEIRDLRAFKMPKIKGSESVKRRATWVLLMPIFSGEPARPKIAGLYEHVVLSSLAESTSQPGVRL